MEGSLLDKGSPEFQGSQAPFEGAASVVAREFCIQGFQAGLGWSLKKRGARPATRMLRDAMATMSHAQGGSLQRSVGLSMYTVLGYPRAAACCSVDRPACMAHDQLMGCWMSRSCSGGAGGVGMPRLRTALPSARRSTKESEQHGHRLLSMKCLHGHGKLPFAGHKE